MSNVLGPYDQLDFQVMSNLKNGIKRFKSENNQISLDKSIKLLQGFLRKKAA